MTAVVLAFWLCLAASAAAFWVGGWALLSAAAGWPRWAWVRDPRWQAVMAGNGFLVAAFDALQGELGKAAFATGYAAVWAWLVPRATKDHP